MSDENRINQETVRLLTTISEMPFAECCPLSRGFNDLPKLYGIYAICHRTKGILYIGKSRSLRQRLRGGHKALGWALIDRLDPDDVRIAYVVVPLSTNRILLQIEQSLIARIRPEYNELIASPE